MWKEHLDSILSNTSIILVLGIIVCFLIKGPIDLFNNGQYHFLHYLKLTIQGTLSSLVFFTILEGVDTLWQRRHKR